MKLHVKVLHHMEASTEVTLNDNLVLFTLSEKRVAQQPITLAGDKTMTEAVVSCVNHSVFLCAPV